MKRTDLQDFVRSLRYMEIQEIQAELEFRALILNGFLFCFVLFFVFDDLQCLRQTREWSLRGAKFCQMCKPWPVFLVCVRALSLSLFLSHDLWCFRHTRNWSLRGGAGFA